MDNKINNKLKIVYRQLLDAIRWFARNSTISVTEILNQLENDVLTGKFEKEELPDNMKFWEEQNDY